jgi:hypothetical protein
MGFDHGASTRLRIAFLIVGLCGATSAWAVAPNPLQNAYWRFEEGPVGTLVDHNAYGPVKDSINENHLEAFSINAAPLYVDDVPPVPLRSGLANNMSLDFLPNNDLFTQWADEVIEGQIVRPGKLINNGVIGGSVAPELTGFTIEAAFKARQLNIFQAIVGKEGRPANDGVEPVDFVENLPTLALKLRGDTNVLQFEQFDRAGNLVEVSSQNPIIAEQWYQTAVVNTGSELMLFLDSNDGMGYQLQGTVAVDGPIYQGPDPDNPDWGHSWTIGRGQFGGNPADWFDGFIDEVKITNRALAPYEFLFAPDSSGMLVGDYNDDGMVDAADYVVWRNNLGGTGLPNDPTPGIVDNTDYLNWKANFGLSATGALSMAAVPEPGTLALGGGLMGVGLLLWRRRQGA